MWKERKKKKLRKRLGEDRQLKSKAWVCIVLNVLVINSVEPSY